MLMQELIKKAREFSYEQYKKTSMPSKGHIDLSTRVSLRLAKELDANTEIVEIGTLLMDCLIGQAFKAGRIQDHVEMSAEKTKDILDKFDLESKTKDNIIACVREHHGVDKFYSIESEICCNADCYRFISVEGIAYSFMNPVGMSLPDLSRLLTEKVDEKWNALTLDTCKRELKPQYKIIVNFLRKLE
jgi:HD superfamily phosphodiesterase